MPLFLAINKFMETERPVSFEELIDLRPRTNEVARVLQTQLVQHLETLRPLLDPARVLGKGSATGRISWMEKSLAEFRGLYEKFARLFRAPLELDPDSVGEIGGKFEVHPWTYIHEARTERETRKITMTSPTRWIVSYPNEMGLDRIKAIVSGAESGDTAPQNQFLLHALLLRLVVEKSPRVVELMKALRFEFEILPCPELHGLPLVTLRFALPSFRPNDSLILKATSLSGVPAFIELVDIEAVRAMKDPTMEQLAKIVG